MHSYTQLIVTALFFPFLEQCARYPWHWFWVLSNYNFDSNFLFLLWKYDCRQVSFLLSVDLKNFLKNFPKSNQQVTMRELRISDICWLLSHDITQCDKNGKIVQWQMCDQRLKINVFWKIFFITQATSGLLHWNFFSKNIDFFFVWGNTVRLL